MPAVDWDMSEFQDPEGTEDVILAAAMAESHLQSIPASSIASTLTSQPAIMTLSHAAVVAVLQPMAIRKLAQPWYDQAEFISTGQSGSLCSDIIKEYHVV
jgi:hypothetical protein